MRVFRRNNGLLCVCNASLALGLWALASAQAQASASAGPPRVASQDENGIQVYLRGGLKTHAKIYGLATTVVDAHHQVLSR